MIKRNADEPAPYRSRKNTGRWCRGKVGRDHAYAWVRNERRSCRWRTLTGQMVDDAWWSFACSICGREKESCVGIFTGCRCGHHDVKSK